MSFVVLDNTLKTGYRWKRTKFHAWRKQWAILTRKKELHYYRTPQDATAGKNPKGTTSLEGAHVRKVGEEVGRRFAFEIRVPMRGSVVWQASNAQEMQEWIEVIVEAATPLVR